MARTTRSQDDVKDEVALKKSGKKDAAGKATPAATAGSKERKVRMKEDQPAKKSTKKTTEKKKSAAAQLVPSHDPNGQTGTEQVAPTEIINESETKHSPKHRDGKKHPSKSLIKKSSKKRKAEDTASDDENEDADESTAAAAETSLAGQSAAGDDDENDGEIDFLAGFESGSEDEDAEGAENSSDEEDAVPITAKDLPQPTQAKSAKQASKGKAKKDVPGVIYLGRIPHGFYEDEMRSYFEQFGEVTRLRLSRNRTTGASKHYAFIEFLHSGVADIVAETMNNYLLNGHILQCRVIPTEEVHPKLWIGANRKFRPVPKGRVERLKHNAPKTEEQKEGIKKRLIKREEGKRNRLKELGIDYDFDGYAKKAAALPSAEERKAVEDAKKLESEVKKDAPAVTAPAKKKAAAKTASQPKKKARKST